MSARIAALFLASVLAALTLFGVGAFSPELAKADHATVNDPRWTPCNEYLTHNVADITNPEYVQLCGDDNPEAHINGYLRTMTDVCPDGDANPNAPGVQQLQCNFVAPPGGLPGVAGAGQGARAAFQSATKNTNIMDEAIKKGLAEGRQRVGVILQFVVNGFTHKERFEVVIDAGPDMQTIRSTSCPGKYAVVKGLEVRSFPWDPNDTVFAMELYANGGSNCTYGEWSIQKSDGREPFPGTVGGCEAANCTKTRSGWFYPGETLRFIVRDEGATAWRAFGPNPVTKDMLPLKIGVETGQVNGATLPAPYSGSPGAGDIELSPERSAQLREEMEASPYFAGPTVAPEAPPQTDPDADPDHDGQPNRTDDDDDGDGLPDPDDPGFDIPDFPPWADPGADPDGDGIPNETDPDDDNDTYPDEEDPYPYDPWPSPHRPDADPDGDGDPNETDPDDDGDGIPDPDDPNPAVPTDPDTLPIDHPWADPDEDGDPNNTDPDDDGDGMPDEADPAPKDPDKGGDLDRDGIPDEADGDQDGDGQADWKDTHRRDASLPGTESTGTDTDGDGVSDYEDPWGGNPYAPEDPNKDGDGDTVPDFQDPEISDPNVPMQPWPPGSPGDVPGNPGATNIPPQPSNPNYPTSPNKPSQPSDPTSTVNPTAPIPPSSPAPEGEAGGPPVATGASCPIPRKPQVSIPSVKVQDVFPFSLVIYAVDLLAQLHGDPEAPVWEFPYLGTMDMAADNGMFAATKVVITGFIICALLVAWYMLIKGSEA